MKETLQPLRITEPPGDSQQSKLDLIGEGHGEIPMGDPIAFASRPGKELPHPKGK